MFEQTFKNIDDILWKDAGCSTELETFPQVYGGLSHLDISLSTEEIWKGQYLKDCEFSLQDNE